MIPGLTVMKQTVVMAAINATPHRGVGTRTIAWFYDIKNGVLASAFSDLLQLHVHCICQNCGHLGFFRAQGLERSFIYFPQ